MGVVVRRAVIVRHIRRISSTPAAGSNKPPAGRAGNDDDDDDAETRRGDGSPRSRRPGRRRNGTRVGQPLLSMTRSCLSFSLSLALSLSLSLCLFLHRQSVRQSKTRRISEATISTMAVKRFSSDFEIHSSKERQQQPAVRRVTYCRDVVPAIWKSKSELLESVRRTSCGRPLVQRLELRVLIVLRRMVEAVAVVVTAMVVMVAAGATVDLAIVHCRRPLTPP